MHLYTYVAHTLVRVELTSWQGWTMVFPGSSTPVKLIVKLKSSFEVEICFMYANRVGEPIPILQGKRKKPIWIAAKQVLAAAYWKKTSFGERRKYSS